MHVLCHRGVWADRAEQNSLEAFVAAFAAGFGVETDVRDALGTLVVSHDPPGRPGLTLDQLLACWAAQPGAGALALNVKADGLAPAVAAAVAGMAHAPVFAFDMAVPDQRAWLDGPVPVFTRHSEHEPVPSFYDRSSGVWLDALERRWWKSGDVAAHLDAGKAVAVVSPELHGRDHLDAWEDLRCGGLAPHPALWLCTDLPFEAKEFFGC